MTNKEKYLIYLDYLGIKDKYLYNRDNYTEIRFLNILEIKN